MTIMARVSRALGSKVVSDVPAKSLCATVKSMALCAQLPAGGISVNLLPGQAFPPGHGADTGSLAPQTVQTPLT